MTRNQENVLYLINLVDAELRLNETGTDEWKDADLAAILEKDSLSSKPRTFGEKLANASERGVGFFVNCEYSLSLLNDYRRELAHTAGTTSEPSRDLSELAYKASRIARATTGRNFDFVSEFARLDLVFERALMALGYYVRGEVGSTVVAMAKSGGFLRADLDWMWRYVNLRNRHVHTGNALTAAERRFVASIESRIVKLVKKELETKAGQKRVAKRVKSFVVNDVRFATNPYALDYQRYLKREHKTKDLAVAIAAEVARIIERRNESARAFLASRA